jgi:Lon-like ATP-dependent protease
LTPPSIQIYRKAALKLVEDLGEIAFPEPEGVVGASTDAPAPATESTATEETKIEEAKEESKESTPAESSSTEATTPSPESTASETKGNTSKAPEEADPEPSDTLPKETTTVERKPMVIPSSVHLRITPENLKDYVGPPVYQRDRMFGGSSSKVAEVTEETQSEPKELTPEEQEVARKEREEMEEAERKERERTAAPPGVSTGLGYLGNGSGAVMPIEAVAMPGKGGLQLTGKLGEVIRESAQIALSWVKAHAFELGVTRNADEILLDGRDVHIHMPEGAVGKDGPSAGTAIVTALVSLVSGRRVDGDIAMTGEMSLTGRVLAVGGLKEKILAAHRAEIKTLLIPAANRSDVEENVPESVKEGIKFVYVESVDEVLSEVFGGVKVGNVKPEEEKEEKDRRRE